MLTLLAAAALATTTPGPTAAPRARAPAEIPAPASLERADVLAWTAANVQGENWMMLAYDREGVKLTKAEAVRKTADGLAEADVRTELFRPIKVSAGVARSGLARWAVDCMSGRLAVTRMTIFSGNNLQGELATRIADEKTWQEPVGAEAEAIAAVCKAVGASAR